MNRLFILLAMFLSFDLVKANTAANTSADLRKNQIDAYVNMTSYGIEDNQNLEVKYNIPTTTNSDAIGEVKKKYIEDANQEDGVSVLSGDTPFSYARQGIQLPQYYTPTTTGGTGTGTGGGNNFSWVGGSQ